MDVSFDHLAGHNRRLRDKEADAFSNPPHYILRMGEIVRMRNASTPTDIAPMMV